MRNMKRWNWFLMLIIAFLAQGCIHDYPSPVKGSPGKGEDPTAIYASIEVSYDLSWEHILYPLDFSTKTKARPQHPHRFVIEVIKDGKVVCHDIEYLTPDEFSLGKLSHTLSANLEASSYQVAVWYDLQDEEGDFPFSAEGLHDVRLVNLSTTNAEGLQCAYASDYLDLTDYGNSDKSVTVNKEIELQHPGARFEIVATDIQQFITDNKEALLQGDTFTSHLVFSSGTPIGFNLLSQTLRYNELTLELSGKLRLPFADYDELKIAEGFIFCDDDREVTLRLVVKNSALVPVCQTDYFSFPIKRGHITTVYGDFLSHPIDGVFSINNIWDDEIVIEI